jgi:ABC-type dipeptide/oligopeptide/nickel transport system ATPase component
VAQISTRIAVMRSGQFVELGPAEQILNQPKNDYTRELLAAVPELPAPERLLFSFNLQLSTVNFFFPALQSPH